MPKFALSVDIDPSGVARLQLGLQRLSEETGRAVPELVTQATRFAVQSARKLTPLSKLRRLRRLPAATRRRMRRRRKTEGIPWWAQYIVTHDSATGSYPRYHRYQANAIRDKTPKRRGLAKAAWTWGLRKTGQVEAAEGADLAAIANAQSEVDRIVDATGHRAEVAVRNNLRYMGVIAPHAAAQGTAKGVSRLQGYMRSLAQKLESEGVL